MRLTGMQSRLTALRTLLSHPLSQFASARFDGAEWALSRAQAVQSAYAEAITHTLTLLGKAIQSLNGETDVAIRDVLWTRGAHPLLPRTEQLQRIEQQLLQLNSQLVVLAAHTPSSTGASAAATATGAVYYVDANWKQTLIEALCTLRFAHYQSLEAVEALLQTLSPVPELLSKRLEAFQTADKTSRDKASYMVVLLSSDEKSLVEMGLTPAAAVETAGAQSDSASDRVLSIHTSFRESGRRATHPVLFPLFDLTSLKAQAAIVAAAESLTFLATRFLHAQQSVPPSSFCASCIVN